MKDSRRFSSTYLKSLFLHVVQHNLLFLLFFFLCFFFFLSGFSLANIQDYRIAPEGGRYLLISFLPLPLASQTLRHQLSCCCRELTSVHSWQSESNMDPLLHALSTLALVAAVFRRMLKTRVTLGNISCVLLNLTKRYLCYCGNSSKVSGHVFIINQHNIFFWQFIF